MKKEIKKLPQSKIEIEFEVPVEEWESFLNKAAKELSKDLKVPGFRPGNVPRNVVEKEVGMAKILERGAELAARKNYIKTILDEKIEAIGTPKISVLKVAPGNPFVFKAEVDVLPEVQLPDYKKIVAEEKPKNQEDIKVDEKEIEQSLEWLQKSRAKLATVSRGAEKGDRVEIDFSGTKDGVNVDKAQSKNHPFILGQGRFVPGFEDQLVGLKEGEKREFPITFPEDYHDKGLAGQKIDFKAKMNLVQEQTLPEINDEFAKSLGNFENMEALKENIKHGVLHEKKEKEKQSWRQKIIDSIAEKSKMEIPEILVSQEAENMLNELKTAASQYRIEWKKYLEQLKKTEEELKKETRPQAVKRVKGALVLREVAKQEKIEVSQEEVNEKINQFLQQYADVEQAKDKVDMERLKEYTYGVLRDEKTLKWLEEISQNK